MLSFPTVKINAGAERLKTIDAIIFKPFVFMQFGQFEKFPNILQISHTTVKRIVNNIDPTSKPQSGGPKIISFANRELLIQTTISSSYLRCLPYTTTIHYIVGINVS